MHHDEDDNEMDSSEQGAKRKREEDDTDDDSIARSVKRRRTTPKQVDSPVVECPILKAAREAEERKVRLAELQARSQALHGVLDQRAQNGRTTAVLEVDTGEKYIGSGVRDIDPVQRGELQAGEVEARMKDEHAEVTVITKALEQGKRPRMMGVSRKICDNCRTFIERNGGTIMSDLTVVWE